MEGRKKFWRTNSSSAISQQQRRLILVAIVIAAVVGTGTANLEQDKQECTAKLMGLAPCLTYVTGGSKAPTLDCCSGLKQVMEKSTKCLCLLIKDRDDPDLGIKVNISLAASLPNTCHSPANVSDCVSILHLAPNSADAKKFDGLDDLISNGNSTTTTPTTGGGGSAASSATSGGSSGGKNEPGNEKSGGEEGMKGGYWWRMVVVGIWGVMLFCF